MQFGKPAHENCLSPRAYRSRLCTETPTAGGRVFEAGDDKLVQLAHTKSSTFPAIIVHPHAHNAYNNIDQIVPLVVVFTQYDRLVKTKIKQFQRKNKNTTIDAAKQQGEVDALEALRVCVESLERSMKKLDVTMPPYAKVSGGYVSSVAHVIAVLVAPFSWSRIRGWFVVFGCNHSWCRSRQAQKWRMADVGNRTTSEPAGQDWCVYRVRHIVLQLFNALTFHFHTHIAKASAVRVVGARFCHLANSIY